MNWTAPSACSGMDVAEPVGKGVGVSEGMDVSVGSGVSVDLKTGVKASAVEVMDTFTALAVNAITVGKYSGG